MYLLNTFLGFFIAQAFDVLKRDKNSKNTPEKFNLIFLLRDTWQKILLSLFLSFGISTVLFINTAEIDSIVSVNGLIYVGVGFAPELILIYARNRFGILKKDRN